MTSIARTRFVVVTLLTLASALGLSSGCGSSTSNGISGHHIVDGGNADTGGSSQGGATGGGGDTSGGGANPGGGVSGGGVTGGGGAPSGGGSSVDAGKTPCTKDGDCTALGLRCDVAAGHCAECLFDNECLETERCVGGSCEPLQTCTNSLVCRTRTDGRTICNATTKLCVQCAADADCGSGAVCAGDTCVPAATCTPNADGGAGCPSNQVCNPAGKCVQCVDDTDCPNATLKCIQSECRTSCKSDNDCKNPLLCDLKMGACVECNTDVDCAATENCASGTCTTDVCAQGVKSCVGNSVVTCNANGSGISTPVACKTDETCVQANRAASCKAATLPDGGTPPPATCNDKTKNGDESDVDCGGSCNKCPDRAVCNAGTDCANGVCQASCTGLLCFPGTRDKLCRSAACNDKTKNGDETDVDCGGGSCARCPVGKKCAQNGDCEADVCQGGTCVAAACTPDQCAPCLLPTDSACCKANGLCGCATVFPFQTPCQ